MTAVRDLLGEHALFEGFAPAHLDLLASLATERSVPAGGLLFREGELAKWCYILRAGRLALEAHSPTAGALVVGTLGPGQLVGWSWLFPPHRWQFDARAVTDVEIVALDAVGLTEVADGDPTFGYPLLRRMLEMSVARLQQARLQVLDVYGGRSSR
ncbi:MAG: cyclic nucleotide-binding domain-containing protein [Acidimicrobiales bacterium]